MAKHSSTVELKVWKEHTCSSCGTVYRYQFTRTHVSYGATEVDASARSNKEAHRSILNETEVRPCPSCGIVQPDMIAGWRGAGHMAVLILSGTALVAVLALQYLLPLPPLVWIASGIMAVTLLAHYLIGRRSFNRDLEKNRLEAQLWIEGNEMSVTKEPSIAAAKKSSHVFAQEAVAPFLLALLVAALFTPSAELVRWQRGWTWNNDWRPGVAGPGDETATYFHDTIETVKGLWRGEARAEALNATELQLPNATIAAQSATTTWDPSLQISNIDKASTPRPWIKIIVPQVPEPAGKTLAVKLDLKVTYPAAAKDGKALEDRQKGLQHTAPLVLSEAGAGRTYVMMWWVTMLLACGAAGLVGVILVLRAQRLKASALPTRVFSLTGSEMNIDLDKL